MDRATYQRYADAFNAKDYDTVYDFYAPDAEIGFLGMKLDTREKFKEFYSFLHSHVVETLIIERFAGSDELVALEGIIRVEGIRDLDRETLDARGMHSFFPITKGEVQEMRQFIHYHLRDGKITSIGLALV